MTEITNQHGHRTLGKKETPLIILKCKKMAIYVFMMHKINALGHQVHINKTGRVFRDNHNNNNSGFSLRKKAALSIPIKNCIKKSFCSRITRNSGQKCKKMEILLSITILIINQIMQLGAVEHMDKDKDHIIWQINKTAIYVSTMLRENAFGLHKLITKARLLTD